VKTFYLGKEKKSALNKEAEILEAMMKKKEASAKSAMTSTRHGVHDFGLLVAAVLVLAALSFFDVQ
jgi:K+-transporting ATPase A subunit